MEKTLNNNGADKGGSAGAAGVSLIEIMISLVLVSLALMAITSTFPSINKNRKGIQEAEQAKAIASQVLEGVQFLTDEEGKCPTTCPADDKICAAYKEDCDAFVLVNYCPKTSTSTKPPITIGIVNYYVWWQVSDETTWGGRTVNVYVLWNKGGKEHTITVTGAI